MRALALIVLWLAGTQAAASGALYSDQQLASSLMDEKVSYSIYLPENHDKTDIEFPVVYLLHGGEGDEKSWPEKGQVQERLNRAIDRGQLPPLIVVMPDGGMSWFMDSADGAIPWESMLLEELIPHIESEYRANSNVDNRGIAGLSMGGFGALSITMRHPELFSSAAAISPSLGNDARIKRHDQKTYDTIYSQVFGVPGLSGDDRLTPHWKKTAPHKLLLPDNLDRIRQSRYWIDCGDDDNLSLDNAHFHELLNANDVEHEFRVRDGGHNWRYWRTGLIPALQFISRGFSEE